MAAWLAARPPLAIRGGLALVGKALRHRAHNVPGRRAVMLQEARILGGEDPRVILVVAPILAGEQHMPGVVIVIVPLCSVVSGRRVLVGRQEARAVVAILEDEMNVPAARTRECAHRATEVSEDMRLAGRV